MPDDVASQDDLIGTAQAMQITGKARATITRWAASGRLPVAHRMPGQAGALLFRRSDLIDAMSDDARRERKSA